MHIFSSEILFLEPYSKEIIRDKYDLKNSGRVTSDMPLDLPKCPFLQPQYKEISELA